MKYQTTIGIDPGGNGGIAWITDGKPCVEKMMGIKEENKTWFPRQTPDDRFPTALLHKKEVSRVQEGELFRFDKVKGFSGRCYEHHNQYDEQPLHHKEFYQSSFPSPTYVHKPFLFSRLGDLASITLARFFHSISFFPSLFSMRDGSDLIVIQSNISCRTLIFHQHGRFGKLAKELDCRTGNTACASSKTFAPSVYPWLFFFHKNGHPPSGKWFSLYEGKILADCLL